MGDVAEHINDMQRIHDEYGQTFDQLSLQSRRLTNAPVRLRYSTYHYRVYRVAEIKRHHFKVMINVVKTNFFTIKF